MPKISTKNSQKLIRNKSIQSKNHLTAGVITAIVGLGALGRYSHWSRAPLIQGSTFAVATMAQIYFSNQDQKLLILGSALLIAGAGLLSKLSWKVNLCATVLFLASQAMISRSLQLNFQSVGGTSGAPSTTKPQSQGGKTPMEVFRKKIKNLSEQPTCEEIEDNRAIAYNHFITVS